VKSALFRKPALVGLDIQPGKIRLVQLAIFKSHYRIDRIARRDLPVGVFRDGVICDWGGLQQELAAFVSVCDLTSAAAAVSLPSHLVRTDHIQVPTGLSRQEKEAAIWGAIKADASHPKAALSIDFVELPADDSGYSSVFFAVAQEAYLTKLIDCMKRAGLFPKIIDIDRYATLRAASFARQAQLSDGTSALLHLCDGTASLIIFNADDILFHQQWLLDEHLINETVQRYLDFYSTMHPASSVQRLLFCGSPLHYGCLREMRVNGQSIFIESVDLASQMHVATHVNDEDFHTFNFDYLLACGLALRELTPW